MDQVLLQRILKSPRLPSLPMIAIEIIELVQQKDVNIKQIAQTISHDPALATKILKTVNSSFYGQAHAISTISHALVVLGLNSVKTLALGFSLVNNLKESGGEGFDHFMLWKRCLYAGVAARNLAKQIGLVQQEEAFLGGLMQDLGMLAMVQPLAPRYPELLKEVGADHRALAARERAVFGEDHAAIGAALAQQWYLPPLLTSSIRYHENPDEAPEDIRPVVRCIALGGYLAEVFINDDPHDALNNFYRFSEQWFQCDRAKAGPLLRDVHKATVEMRRLFDLPTGELENPDQILSRANEALMQMNLQQQMQADQLEKKNRLLVEQAHRDALTGVANRRKLSEFLEAEFPRAGGRNPLSLLFLDTDNFKIFNDTYGHQVGDKVLVEKASVLSDAAPDGALVARYGGEEFAVVLPNTDRITAAKLAEAIRQKIAATTVEGEEGQLLRITASIGVATHDGSCFAGQDQLIKAADQSVYAAKKAGRNCVRVFAPREPAVAAG